MYLYMYIHVHMYMYEQILRHHIHVAHKPDNSSSYTRMHTCNTYNAMSPLYHLCVLPVINFLSSI